MDLKDKVIKAQKTAIKEQSELIEDQERIINSLKDYIEILEKDLNGW